ARHAGLTTVGVSANPLVSRGTNLAQGFETFVELPWDPKAKQWGSAADVNDAFVGWLARNRSRRFVGYLHYIEPHDPYTPPPAPPPPPRPPPRPGLPPAVPPGGGPAPRGPPSGGGATPLPDDQVAYLRALYDGEIRSWDAALPALLDALARLGVRDSTIVIVT